MARKAGSDLRDEAKEVLGDQPEVPFGETGLGIEYHVFTEAAYNAMLLKASNDNPIESKSDVMTFMRDKKPGKYIVIKVADELEVVAPRPENIIRSNPRQKKPRTKVETPIVDNDDQEAFI